jgi:hypothetical protein
LQSEEGGECEGVMRRRRSITTEAFKEKDNHNITHTKTKTKQQTITKSKFLSLIIRWSGPYLDRSVGF